MNKNEIFKAVEKKNRKSLRNKRYIVLIKAVVSFMCLILKELKQEMKLRLTLEVDWAVGR